MNAKILVIDDEESIRFTFREFLSEEGYEVFCSEDYAGAMEVIEKTDLDLVFADIILGERTGIDILKAVKEKGLLCPVIVITGQPNIDTAADSVRLGAFDYLPKPVHQGTLLRVAKIALAHKTVVVEKERYRNNLDAIFRSVMDAIITLDGEMRVTESNEAVEAIFGLAPDQLLGRPLQSVFHNSLESCETLIRDILHQQKTVREYRVECRIPQRPRLILEVNGSPLVDRKNHALGALLVIRDVTRMNDLESELRDRHSFHNIIGKSKKMQEIFQLVENLADIQTTVLITGESGTGKELIARALHYGGPRAYKPLVTVNCSTLVENLLESELFGHVKGAFTGANRDKVGRFQEADGGSIFLDEIGDISPALQLKLLRVLQTKEFERVGDSSPIKVDVRIIAATNRRLREEVKQNRFREDLYYRLKVVEIKLPPLRERIEDVPLLIDHFCRHFNGVFKKDIRGVRDDVLELFVRYPWPGNVRELEHALERAFVFCRGDEISPDHLPPEIPDTFSTPCRPGQGAVDEMTPILLALEKAGGNKAKAARMLGMSRKTLYKKIKKHHVPVTRIGEET